MADGDAPRSLREDLPLVAWSAATFAMLLASFSVFRPVRDSLVLDGRPDDIPWLFLGTFVAVSIASPLWSALLARRSKRRVVPIAFHVFALMALCFAFIVEKEIAPVAVGRVFYIWSSVFNLFVVSVFWSLLADLVGPATAKRRFGPISIGGTIGAFCAPLLTKLLVVHIDVSGVLVMSALFLELAAIGVHNIRRTAEERAVPPPDEPVRSDLLTGLRQVVRSRYLLAICGYVLCTAIAATLLYIEQAFIIDRELADRVTRTEFFATLDMWTQGITFVIQTFIATALLRWGGPGVVLCILPVVQLVCIATLVTTGGTLTLLAVVMVATNATRHGLMRPAREVLFTAVEREDKYHAKNVIDTIVYRSGDVVGGWLHKGLVAVSAGAGALAIASVPLAAIWIGLAITLGAGFRGRTQAR